MLVLARGIGQSIEVFDGEMTITVLSIQGSIVRLGFDAPREIPIVRQEVSGRRRLRAPKPDSVTGE
jgi:carbon storage regulator